MEAANAFLGHLEARGYSPATVRGYAYDLVCFCRFCDERCLSLGDITPAECFESEDPGKASAGDQRSAAAVQGPAA